MHHASVSLSDGTTFLVGGRQSPYFMCNQMLKICLDITPEHSNLPENRDNKQFHSHDPENDTKPNQPSCVANSGSTVRANGETSEGVHQSTILSESSLSSLSNSQAKEDLKRRREVQHKNPDCDTTDCEHVQSTFPCDFELELESVHHENSSYSDFSCSFHMGHVHISVIDQKGTVPRERWRHAAADVIINGKS